MKGDQGSHLRSAPRCKRALSKDRASAFSSPLRKEKKGRKRREGKEGKEKKGRKRREGKEGKEKKGRKRREGKEGNEKKEEE